MHNLNELKVWQKSRAFVKEIYLVTSKFPTDERFGIIAQFRRASVSIALNVAEGAGKNSNIDFCRFLDNAYGSAVEVETLTYLSIDLGYLDNQSHDNLLKRVTEIQKMLHSRLQRMRKS